MTVSEKDHMLITKFLDLELSEQELLAFEERLENDATFGKAVQSYMVANSVVNDRLRTDTETSRTQQWKGILDTQAPKTIQKTTMIPWKWVGSIAVVLAVIIVIWNSQRTTIAPDMDLLLTNAWGKQIGLDYASLRALDVDSIKTHIHRSFDLYQYQKYEQSLDALAVFNIKNTVQQYEDVLLLRGLSHYKMGNAAMALQTLDSLATYPTGKKSEVARWYQGIIYLEMGDTEAAQQFIVLPKDSSQGIQLKN